MFSLLLPCRDRVGSHARAKGSKVNRVFRCRLALNQQRTRTPFQSTTDRGREMLCSPELHRTTKDTRIQQRSATMIAVYLCPTRNTLFLTIVTGLWITHPQVRAVCEAESNVRWTNVACGWSSTNTPPDEGGQNYLHVPTQGTLVWLV